MTAPIHLFSAHQKDTTRISQQATDFLLGLKEELTFMPKGSYFSLIIPDERNSDIMILISCDNIVIGEINGLELDFVQNVILTWSMALDIAAKQCSYLFQFIQRFLQYIMLMGMCFMEEKNNNQCLI